jgi:hypothetical protein
MDLLDYIRSRMSMNNVVIPTLQAFNALLEAEALEDVTSHPSGKERLAYINQRQNVWLNMKGKNYSLECLLYLVNRNLAGIKSLPRIYQSMKM